MKVSELLVLCVYVLSSIADTMDRIHLAGIYREIDHEYKLTEINSIKYQNLKIIDSKCKRNENFRNTNYNSASQTEESLKDSKEQVITRQKNKHKGKHNTKKEMKINTQTHIANEGKIDTLSKCFVHEYFPAFHKFYYRLTRKVLKAELQLDRNERTVNKAVTNGNPTDLTKYYSEYKHLVALLGPPSCIYNKTYDCMALVAQVDKIINFDYLFDCAFNLYNEILTMEDLSDAYFALVARRYIVFSSLRGDIDSLIGVQKKLVGRFPQSIAELSKLGEMQYTVSHKLAPQGVFEKVVELDQYIGENVATDEMFFTPLM